MKNQLKDVFPITVQKLISQVSKTVSASLVRGYLGS